MPGNRAADMAQASADVSAKVAYGTAGSAVFLSMTVSDWAACAGIVAAIVTTLVNWYYRRKAYILAEARAKFDGVTIDED